MVRRRTSSANGVTFADFAKHARKNGWPLDDLVREFRGGFGGNPEDPSYESSREFFERVFAGRPSPTSVIVYAPVLRKYYRAIRSAAVGDRGRRCECGCGKPIVFSRKRFWADACRQRAKRERDRRQRLGALENDRNGKALPEVFP